MDIEKSLKQSEIEALIAGISGGGLEEAEEATETIPASSAPEALPPSEPRAPTSVTESMDAVTARQAEDSAMLSKKSDHSETAMAETQAAIRDIQRDLQDVVGTLQILNGRFEEIAGKLRETPVYGVKSGFKCAPCGSQGLLAVPVRCTGCGHETLWGWWPKRQ